jgi:quinol monooxygenase YgiN
LTTKIIEFVAAYGQNGVWVKFFSRDRAYLGTTLYRDLKNPSRFITSDHWRSKADRDEFRQKNSVEFEEIDKSCESLTENETLIGDFEIAD